MHLEGVLTVDDRDAEIGLDNGAEVEAAGGSLLSVDEDHVHVFDLVTGEESKCRNRASTRCHWQVMSEIMDMHAHKKEWTKKCLSFISISTPISIYLYLYLYFFLNIFFYFQNTPYICLPYIPYAIWTSDPYSRSVKTARVEACTRSGSKVYLHVQTDMFPSKAKKRSWWLVIIQQKVQ